MLRLLYGDDITKRIAYAHAHRPGHHEVEMAQDMLYQDGGADLPTCTRQMQV